MSLITALHAEWLKSKRTAAFYLTLVAGALIPFIHLLDGLVDGVPAEMKEHAFNKFYGKGNEMIGFAIFPLFIVLIATLLPQIEFKNNTWKQVLASPQSKLNIFIAKFLSIHLLIILFLVTFNAGMLVDMIVFHFLNPGLHILQQQVDITAILQLSYSKYLALLAMSAIQFWLGLRFKNFIFPVTIGFCCWFASSLMVLEYKAAAAKYNPFSLHIYSMSPDHRSELSDVYFISAVYATLFLFFGFLDFKRRRMHG